MTFYFIYSFTAFFFANTEMASSEMITALKFHCLFFQLHRGKITLHCIEMLSRVLFTFL